MTAHIGWLYSVLQSSETQKCKIQVLLEDESFFYIKCKAYTSMCMSTIVYLCGFCECIAEHFIKSSWTRLFVAFFISLFSSRPLIRSGFVLFLFTCDVVASNRVWSVILCVWYKKVLCICPQKRSRQYASGTEFLDLSKCENFGRKWTTHRNRKIAVYKKIHFRDKIIISTFEH